MPAGQRLSVIAAGKSRIESALKAGDPVETDHVLEESLKPLVTCWTRVPIDYAAYPGRGILGLHLSGDTNAARELLKAAMTPAPRRELIDALARCRYLTVSRSTADEDMKYLFAAYASSLAEQPGDAVLTALRRWPERNKWWPALSEIIEAAWQTCEFRKMIREALNG